MKRKLNFTGRQRIKREKISIRFIRRNGSIVSFDLNKLDIDDLRLPPDAMIFVEAYYRTELKQFCFGTVAERRYPPSLSLTDLAYPENLKFRILIVNSSNRMVLAHAAGITPEEPSAKKSILPVEFKDLGSEIWRVEYEGDEGAPILCINNKIPGIDNIAEHDPQFFIYVYPAVLREILTHMIFVEGIDSTADPSVDWHKHWLVFCRNLGVIPPETLNRNDDNFDEDAALEWIDNAVTAFSSAYRGKFNEYLQKIEEVS